jgi:hypothetical protein
MNSIQKTHTTLNRRINVRVSGTQVRGFEPGQSCRIFQGEKILSVPCFGGKVKPSVPCRRFEACKKFLHLAWKPPFVGKITGHFSPTVPPFATRGLSRRLRRGSAWRWNLELPKQGSYNKLIWLRYLRGH